MDSWTNPNQSRTQATSYYHIDGGSALDDVLHMMVLELFSFASTSLLCNFY